MKADAQRFFFAFFYRTLQQGVYLRRLLFIEGRRNNVLLSARADDDGGQDGNRIPVLQRADHMLSDLLFRILDGRNKSCHLGRTDILRLLRLSGIGWSRRAWWVFGRRLRVGLGLVHRGALDSNSGIVKDDYQDNSTSRIGELREQ